MKCSRCEDWYVKLLDSCPHCAELSDTELSRIKEERAEGATKIGRLFLIIAIVVFLLMITFIL